MSNLMGGCATLWKSVSLLCVNPLFYYNLLRLQETLCFLSKETNHEIPKYTFFRTFVKSSSVRYLCVPWINGLGWCLIPLLTPPGHIF